MEPGSFNLNTLEEAYAKINAHTPLERLRVLTIVWMVRDIKDRENWEYSHAVLDYHPEIEAKLGAFPGHDEVQKSGAAEWKDNFNNIYDTLEGTAITFSVNNILDKEFNPSSFNALADSFMPIAKTGEINTLLELYYILSIEQHSMDIYQEYAKLVTEPEFELTSAETLRLLKWYFPEPRYNRIRVTISLKILCGRFSAAAKMPEAGAVLLLFIWVLLCKEYIDKNKDEYPAAVLLKNEDLCKAYPKPIAFAQKMLDTAELQKEFSSFYRRIATLARQYDIKRLLQLYLPDICSFDAAWQFVGRRGVLDRLIHLHAIFAAKTYEGYMGRSSDFELLCLDREKYELVKACASSYCARPIPFPVNQQAEDAVSALQAGDYADPSLAIPFCLHCNGKFKDGIARVVVTAEMMKNLEQKLKGVDPVDFLRRIQDNCEDYAIENSVAYERLVHRTGGVNSLRVLIVNPNYEFVRSWNADIRAANAKVTFAVGTDDIAQCLSLNKPVNTEYISRLPSAGEASYTFILFFARGMEETQIAESLIRCRSLLAPDGELAAILPDLFFSGDSIERQRAKALDNAQITITTFPMGLAKSAPRKKLYVELADICFDSVVQLSAFAPQDAPKGAMFLQSEPVVIVKTDTITDGKPADIRKLLREIKVEPPERKHNPPRKYLFSREITIYYSIAPVKSEGGYRATVYVCELTTEKQRRRNKLTRGKRIPASEIQLRARTVDELIAKVEDKAPFREKIRAVLSEQMQRAYREGQLASISLKTFWYCREEVLRERSAYNATRAAGLFLSGEASRSLSNCILGEADFEDYLNGMNELFRTGKVNSQAEQAMLWRQLDLILQEAVRQNYIYGDNPVRAYIKTISVKDKTQEIRDALVKKSLTGDEEIRLIKWIQKQLFTENTGLALGVALRLFTAMEPDEICALTWKDRRKLPYLDTYCLQISRRTGDTGNKTNHEAGLTIPLRTKARYRIIPIVSALNEMLHTRYKPLKEKYGEKALEDYPIASHPKDDSCRCEPKSLRDFSRKALTEGARIPSNLIRLPNKAGGEAADMSRYMGDLYRSNFKYRALGVCGMALGEVCYLLGIQSDDTFSRHYCDYSNDLSQLSMTAKLERWKTQYTRFEGAPVLREFEAAEGAAKLTAKAINSRNAAMEIVLEIPPAGDDAVIEVRLESKYGVSGSAVLAKKS